MKRLIVTIQFMVLLALLSCGQSTGKNGYEKNGVTVRFLTTQLGEIVNEKFELIDDMEEAGVLIFIPEHKSIVLRHNSGQDELLKIDEVNKTEVGSYLFSCTKNRLLFVSTSEKKVSYAIEGSSSIFLLPIDEKDIDKLKGVLVKF